MQNLKKNGERASRNSHSLRPDWIYNIKFRLPLELVPFFITMCAEQSHFETGSYSPI